MTPTDYAAYHWVCPTCDSCYFGVCPPEDCSNCYTPGEDFECAQDLAIAQGFEYDDCSAE